MSATLTDVLERREQHIRDLQRLDDAERAKRQALYPSYTPLAPEPTPTIAIRTLVGAQGLPHDAREIRRYLEAVALCLGAPSPAQSIPKTWVPLVHTLHAARARQLSWREALQEVGLELPSDLTSHTAVRQQELRALWEQLPWLIGRAMERNNGIGQNKLLTHLRSLLR